MGSVRVYLCMYLFNLFLCLFFVLFSLSFFRKERKLRGRMTTLKKEGENKAINTKMQVAKRLELEVEGGENQKNGRQKKKKEEEEHDDEEGEGGEMFRGRKQSKGTRSKM